MAHVEQEARSDGDGLMALSSSPANQTPASNPSHNQAVPTPTVPVNKYSLTGYKWNSEYHKWNHEYTDLEITCENRRCSVHRIIVCSESPVIKAMCSNLESGMPLSLDHYDLKTVTCVLSFCYRRTYSDGEFPPNVAHFLTSMTSNDVRDALEAPLAVLSDVEDPGWVVESTECDGSKDTEQEQDEYLPSSCDIHCALEYDSDSSEDEIPSVETPSEPQQPPYEISLSANFKVYIAAKELEIPALQLVARERFAHSLQAHWGRFVDLPALIEQVYSETDESDPLRALICQVAAAGYDSEFEMAFKDEIRELMTKNGQFAAEVLDATLRLRRGWIDTWE